MKSLIDNLITLTSKEFDMNNLGPLERPNLKLEETWTDKISKPGVTISDKNGWSFSIQWSINHYGDNYRLGEKVDIEDKIRRDKDYHYNLTSTTAEIAIYNTKEEADLMYWADEETGVLADDIKAYVPYAEVIEIIDEMNNGTIKEYLEGIGCKWQ